MASSTWTLAADWTADVAKKIDSTTDTLTLWQYLKGAAETCSDIDTTNAWADASSGGGSVAVNSGLWRFSCGDASAGNSVARLTSAAFFTISGNFDLQYDFANISDSASGAVIRWYTRLVFYVDAANYAYVARIKNAAATDQYQAFVIAGGVTAFNTAVAASGTSGKLRIVRTNTDDIYCYYWGGADWTLIDSTLSGFSTAGYLRPEGIHSNGGTGTFYCDVDNLTLNSGTVVNGYYQDSPTAEGATKDSGVAGTTHDMSSAAATVGGAGTTNYQWWCSDSDPGAYNGSWLSLAQLQAVDDPSGRYFKLKFQMVSDGTQACTLSDISVSNNVTGVEFPLTSRGARGGLGALSGGLAA